MKALSTVLCNNILERGMRDKIPITPMKLQKLMYYVCRDYVQATGEMPISDDFEVWKYGPVLSAVYAEFSSYGPKPITEFAKDAQGQSYKVSESKNPLLSMILDVVWAKYKNLSGVELSRKTHLEGSGWHRAYMEYREKITLEDIKNDKTE